MAMRRVFGIAGEVYIWTMAAYVVGTLGMFAFPHNVAAAVVIIGFPIVQRYCIKDISAPAFWSMMGVLGFFLALQYGIAQLQ